MDVFELTNKIVDALEQDGFEYEYDGIVSKLQDNPDIIYDRLVLIAKSGVSPDTFYDLAEDVVEFEKTLL